MDSGNMVTLEQKNSAGTADKRRDVVELSVAYALILAVIWTPRQWQKILYFVAATFIVTSVWSSFPGWKAMGLRTANLAHSIWLVGAALIAAVCAVAVASRIHTLHPPGGPTQFIERYTGYVIFAFVQQWLMQDFFLPRMLRIMPGPGFGAIAAAAIFSLAHLPNPILTVATFAWGLASCLFFLRYRSLYPLAVAHAILGITLAITIPGPVIRNMRVGLGYLAYSRHPVDHRNH